MPYKDPTKRTEYNRIYYMKNNKTKHPQTYKKSYKSNDDHIEPIDPIDPINESNDDDYIEPSKNIPQNIPPKYIPTIPSQFTYPTYGMPHHSFKIPPSNNYLNISFV